MPFQDLEEDSAVEAPQPPGAFERFMRKVFLEDLGLKLLALAITLFVWLAVTDENQPVTIHTAVQLNFIRPQNLGIANDPPRTVEVLLTGTRHKLNNLRPLDLVATVNLSDSSPGERVIRLSTERVTIPLPAGVTIDSFQPGTIPVRLEPIAHQLVPVKVSLDGNPAEGYEVYEAHPSLSEVKIAGPAGHVREIKEAPTETISLDNRKESFTVSRVSIAIPDQKVEVIDGVIDVSVKIGEKRIERQIEHVPVRSSSGSSIEPRQVDITLLGPATLLNQLRPQDISIVVEKSPAGENIPHLQLPGDAQSQVKLVSIKPNAFH